MIERRGSPAPLTILFISAILTPWVVLQSTFAVLYVALDKESRGAVRLFAPAIDVVTMALAALIACGFAVILMRSAREYGVGWVGIGAGVALVLGGSFVNDVIVSVRRQVVDDYAEPAAVVAAYEASDTALFVGTALVVVMLLLAPVIARANQPLLQWARGAYIALCAIFALYGVIPLVAQIVKYG